jgi:hypothetical protein
MDGKIENENCALANEGTTFGLKNKRKEAAKINNDDIILLFYLLITCMHCFCHTVLLGTNSTLKSLAAKICIFCQKKYEGFYPEKQYFTHTEQNTRANRM